METDREFIVLYSQEEMRSKIEELKSLGYREEDFHVLVDDEAVLSAEDTSRIDVHETGTLGNTFKTMFTGRDAVREKLKSLDLEERQVDRYEEELEKRSDFTVYGQIAIERRSEHYGLK
ncbi:general stress protein [Planococcus sp. 107-1]|uniref:general stress protein n=1 Tax=Planococcus sp. 107-1 TaxID=2908840 RepID=UPI001F3AFC7D|nr:general stress protein [Planococcus sp. 107-1]UJF25996.1 general stress protein [Planococcus sp. 107-1]